MESFRLPPILLQNLKMLRLRRGIGWLFVAVRLCPNGQSDYGECNDLMLHQLLIHLHRPLRHAGLREFG